MEWKGHGIEWNWEGNGMEWNEMEWNGNGMDMEWIWNGNGMEWNGMEWNGHGNGMEMEMNGMECMELNGMNARSSQKEATGLQNQFWRPPGALKLVFESTLSCKSSCHGSCGHSLGYSDVARTWKHKVDGWHLVAWQISAILENLGNFGKSRP